MQRRSQEFVKGTKEGIWGTEVPQRGPGAEPRWESWSKAARAGDRLNIRLNKAIDRHKSRTVQSLIIRVLSSYNWGHAPMPP